VTPKTAEGEEMLKLFELVVVVGFVVFGGWLGVSCLISAKRRERAFQQIGAGPAAMRKREERERRGLPLV